MLAFTLIFPFTVFNRPEIFDKSPGQSRVPKIRPTIFVFHRYLRQVATMHPRVAPDVQRVLGFSRATDSKGSIGM